MINGQAHGPQRGTATCQLHMRKFPDGDEIVVEPWRARGVPDHQGPDVRPLGARSHHRGRRVHHGRDRWCARRQPHPGSQAGRRRRRARRRCASAAARAWRRARTVPPTCSPAPRSPTSTSCRRARPSVTAGRRDGREMEAYFGSCTNHGECEAACPKEISIDVIALMNADYLKAKFKNRRSLSRADVHCVPGQSGRTAARSQRSARATTGALDSATTRAPARRVALTGRVSSSCPLSAMPRSSSPGWSGTASSRRPTSCTESAATSPRNAHCRRPPRHVHVTETVASIDRGPGGR